MPPSSVCCSPHSRRLHLETGPVGGDAASQVLRWGPGPTVPVPRGMRTRRQCACRQTAAAADAAPGGTWTAGVRLRALGSQACRGPVCGILLQRPGAHTVSAFPPRADTGFIFSCSALTHEVLQRPEENVGLVVAGSFGWSVISTWPSPDTLAGDDFCDAGRC